MPEIEQPAFDELATGSLKDLDEVGEAILNRAHYKGITKLGVTVGVYWRGLIEMGVPRKDATRITIEWMHICGETE